MFVSVGAVVVAVASAVVVVKSVAQLERSSQAPVKKAFKCQDQGKTGPIEQNICKSSETDHL